MNLLGKQVIVLGAGSSGRAAAALALREGASVSVHDSSEVISHLAEGILSVPRASVESGNGTHCDLLVLSPGIDGHSAFAKSYAKNAKEVIGELELASCFYQGKVIAITGTNGKTTTTEIVDKILNDSGISCLPCGNHGMPLSELVMMENPPMAAALEVSSFQLETIQSFHPDVAIWLNFSPDHMDRYPTLETYKSAKLRIFENMTAENTVIVRAGEDIGEIQCKRIEFSTEDEADLVFIANKIIDSGKVVLDLEPTRLRGLHNAENAMAAYAACAQLGVSPTDANQALQDFQPPAHRCELIGTIDGVEYINDSKATNLYALDSALRSQSRPVILIAGGKQKGLEYSELLSRLTTTTKAVIVFGEIADQLMETFSDISNQVTSVKVATLETAVSQAKEFASDGDVVLFSPGTSSFDMFSGYEDRGDRFREIVNHLN